MLSTAIILPGDTEMFTFNSLQAIQGVEWDGIFLSGKRRHPSFDRSLIYSSPELIPLICDLLIVVDPQFCTMEYLSFAIRNGCHLFLSDKLSLSEEERKQLVHLADEGNTYIRIQNDFLFHPFHNKIKVESNHATFIEASQSFTSMPEQIDKLLNDNLLMILRAASSSVQRVDVLCGLLPSQEPDFINVDLNFKNGTVAALRMVFSEQDETHLLSVHTGKKVSIFDFTQNKITYLPENGSGKTLTKATMNPLTEQISDLISDIREKKTPSFSLEHEITVLLLMEKIRKNIENQAILQIPSIHLHIQ